MFLKNIRLIISILLLSLVASAQENEADSLKNLLKESKGIDKLNILFKLSDLKANDPEGVEYAKDAIDLAKKINEKAKADAIENLGKVYYYQNQNSQALVYFKQSLDLSSKSNYIEGVFRGLNRIAQAYYYSDSIEQSEKISRQLLLLARQKDSTKQEANAYFQLGQIAKEKGNSDSALILMNKALELRKIIGDQRDIAKTYNGIGLLYYEMANYQESFDCFTKEIKIKELLNDLYGLAVAYMNFGYMQINMSNYQPALEQFQNALKTFEQIGNQEGIARTCNGIGMVYENLSQSTLAVKDNEANYNKALEYYQRTLEIFRKLEFKSEEGKSLQNIANTYSRLATNQFVAKYGEAWEDSLHKISTKDIQTSFEKSIENYNKSLEIFKESEDETQIAIVDINLGANYSLTRNWSKANQYLNEGLNLSRKLNLPYEKVNALFADRKSVV